MRRRGSDELQRHPLNRRNHSTPIASQPALRLCQFRSIQVSLGFFFTFGQVIQFSIGQASSNHFRSVQFRSALVSSGQFRSDQVSSDQIRSVQVSSSQFNFVCFFSLWVGSG